MAAMRSTPISRTGDGALVLAVIRRPCCHPSPLLEQAMEVLDQLVASVTKRTPLRGWRIANPDMAVRWLVGQIVGAVT